MKDQEPKDTICITFDCVQLNKNKDIVIEGLFRKFTPIKKGKGANRMYWDWEILLEDGIALPVTSRDAKLDLSSFENKKVRVECNAFFGVIIGSPEPEAQNATGYRLDIDNIQEL